MLQNLTPPPPSPKAGGAAFQALRPDAGPRLGTVPQTPLRGPLDLGLQPLAWPLPPTTTTTPLSPHCWLEGQRRVKTSVAGFCLSLGGRGGGVQTRPDVVGLWAAEAAGLGEGVLSRRERRRGADVGAYFIEAGSSDLQKV